MKPLQYTLATFVIGLPGLALSDVVHDDDVIISAPMLCVGSTCADGESNPTAGELIKLKGASTSFRMVDISTQTGFPTHNWQIQANENFFGGMEALFFQDLTANTVPFTIGGDAPDSSLYIAATGDVGIGTATPLSTLHVYNDNSPILTMEQTNPVPFIWEVVANHGNLLVRDDTNNQTPFAIRTGAQSGAFLIDSNGYVGMGTTTPGAPLELVRPEGFNFFRITATGAAVNDSVDITYTGGPLGTGQLRYNIVDGDNQEMSLDADGNMVIDGTLTTAGPTCAGGCDRVFDEGYALPSIDERADQMFADGHLPAVGPTQPGQPVNVTEKMGDMLNELEHAHIYIAQLHGRLDTQEALVASLQADIAALTAQMATLSQN